MTQIKKILDKQGDEVFIRTSTKAVVDDNGYTAESRLQAMQDEINQAQLEIGAVPSDLAPEEGSTNWVTSGGLYNALNVGEPNVPIDLTDYTQYMAYPNPTKWITNNSSYPYYSVFVPVTSGDKIRIVANATNGSVYAFLTTDSHANNTNVSYASDCTRTSINAGETEDLIVPADAAYLYIVLNTSTDRTPQSVKIINKRSLSDILSNVDSTPTKNSENLVTSGGVFDFNPTMEKVETFYTIDMDARNYQLNTSTWLSRTNGHVVIPCTGGDTFVLYNAASGDGGFYGWLTSDYVQPTSASTIPYVTGTGRLWLNKATELTVTAPDGTAYLCVCPNDGGGSSYWRITHTYRIPITDELDTKASIEYVDNEIVKAHYDMVQLEKTWVTNDSSVISAAVDGNDVVITVSGTTSYKRCGINISDINIGESVYFYFSEIPHQGLSRKAQIVIGVGETLASTFVNVGTFTKPFFFTKTSASQKYLYTPASSYSAGTTITLKNFKFYKATGFTELDARVTELESHDFQPSSYIPINESYEKLMNISATSGQGGTIYGNYFVQAYTYANRKIDIYNLETKELVQNVDLPTFDNPRYHSNTICFSGNKYESGDDFPLLYICSGYTDTTSVTTSEVYVVRIIGTSGSYTTSLIQTIYLDFGHWTEFVIDRSRNRAWINGSGIAKYICVALPATTESEVTIDANTTIIDKFDTKNFLLGTTTNSSNQGRFFYHNRIYYVSGVPSYEGEGTEALYVVVDNILTHCTEAVVPLMDFGLTGEPESCFIWNNDFYVAYRSQIVKLIQN